ncbi:MAG: hypothetical protein QXX95_06190 [Nitrososphaerales archaeon]
MPARVEGPYEEFLKQLIDERRKKLEFSTDGDEIEKLKKEIEFLEGELRKFKEKITAHRPLHFKP